MSEPITIADIYKLFEKTNAALERSRQEFDRSLAESRAEFDHRMAESDRRAAEAKAESDRLAAEAKAERERSMANLEKTVQRTSKAVDSLTTRWGRFVEELVRPAVVRMFRDRDILITHTMERVRSPKDALPMEIDILGVNGMKVVAVECKSRLSKDDVDEMCDRLTRFKQSFPEYAQYTLYGAVAGIEINEGIDFYAYRKGLFVIRTSGDTVEIANDQKFKAIAW